MDLNLELEMGDKMTGHELAKLLLALPDKKVVIDGLGRDVEFAPPEMRVEGEFDGVIVTKANVVICITN